MHHTKITGFIALSAISAFLLTLSFTPLAGGDVHLTSRTTHSPGIELPGVDGLVVTGADSVKKHGIGGAGTVFPINLPLSATLTSGTSGVECREGGDSDNEDVAGRHTIVIHFSGPNPPTGGTAFVTHYNPLGGGGEVDNVSFVGFDMIVTLTFMSNAQVVTITAVDVTDGTTELSDFDVNVGFLIGDTTANRRVNVSDIAQTKSQSGALVDGTNFREDLTVNGEINSSDVSSVKAASGKGIP